MKPQNHLEIYLTIGFPVYFERVVSTGKRSMEQTCNDCRMLLTRFALDCTRAGTHFDLDHQVGQFCTKLWVLFLHRNLGVSEK